MRTIWYFPLEPVDARYTTQLCTEWMPNAFKRVSSDQFVTVEGEATTQEIRAGVVLDACGRGIYSCTQIAKFLKLIAEGQVQDGDTLFFQDFWTPGIEAIPYALHLHGIATTQYAMCHAQSVDEYDFTSEMLPWIRGFEIGLDRWLTGIFVASTVHKAQLRAADFRAPIHVVGLPIDVEAVETLAIASTVIGKPKHQTVIFTSRLDAEKNPEFMLQVAERFLKSYPDWTWHVTTSGKQLRSNLPEVVQDVRDFASRHDRFVISEGLTKSAYYRALDEAAIQFNCSSQDYVSWTLLEAVIFGCDIAYPAFRSFPECVPSNRLYAPSDLEDAMEVLGQCVEMPLRHKWIAEVCDRGRIQEAAIIHQASPQAPELNVWRQ